MRTHKEKITRRARTEETAEETTTDVRDEKLDESTRETLGDIACCLADLDEVIDDEDEEQRLHAEYDAALALRHSDYEEYVYRMKLLAEQHPNLVLFVCDCGGVCNFGWTGKP